MEKEMIMELLPTVIMVLAFTLFPLVIFLSYKKKKNKERKEIEELVKNTKPIKVELYDVIEYTQYRKNTEGHGSSTMIRLSPIFKDVDTGQLYIHTRFENLGDIKIKYIYPPNENPKLQIITNKGKIINEKDTGNIYIKNTIGNVTYYDDLLDIGNGKYIFKGKLNNYHDAFGTNGNVIFNIMKDEFINEIINAIIIDAHIDFDLDDQQTINPY